MWGQPAQPLPKLPKETNVADVGVLAELLFSNIPVRLALLKAVADRPQGRLLLDLRMSVCV